MPENAPGFIHDFSKENDQEGRNETAKLILEKRAESREQAEAEKAVALRIEELQQKLSKAESNWFNKLRQRGEIAEARKELDGLTAEEEDGSEDRGDLPEEKNEGNEAQEMLDSYYAKQKAEWREAGYEEEDVKRYFTEENLSSLDLDDYALLLSRFPSEMATHVTRQGVRDHTSMDEHRAGMGEYSDGFVKILEDGRLRSLVSKLLASEDREETIGEFFKWLVEQTRLHNSWIKVSDREIIENVIEKEKRGVDDWQSEQEDEFIYNTNSGSYSDRSALHLARGVVMDSCYGGEEKNEAFFAYPVGHFFAEHQFQNKGMDNIDKNNDTWLWTKENKGLSVNAALVFLPKSTPVDPETGSKYFLDEERKPVVDMERLEQITKLIDDPDFVSFYINFSESYRKSDQERFEKGQGFEKELAERFNISDPIVTKMISESVKDYEVCNDLLNETKDQKVEARGKLAERILLGAGSYFQPAQETVPAQEYWERYFTNNPELKPSKVVYYEGTPTKALERWQSENGIINHGKKSFAETFDFYKVDPEKDQARLKAAYYQGDEYIDLCEKVLDRTFPVESSKEMIPSV